MSWVLDGRVGSAMIHDRRRYGISWTRNLLTKEVQFVALPRSFSIDKSSKTPPALEEFTIPESSFLPAE